MGRRMNNTTIAAQRSRILNHLRNSGPLTTLEARNSLDVMHPAARVMELRQQGFNIVTHRRTDYTDQGDPHVVAQYVLFAKEGSQ